MIRRLSMHLSMSLTGQLLLLVQAWAALRIYLASLVERSFDSSTREMRLWQFHPTLTSMTLKQSECSISLFPIYFRINKYFDILVLFCQNFFSIIVYEGGSVLFQARSLWRIELARTKWSGGYINWFHPFRIRHITTGLYLGSNENNDLVLLTR